LAGGGIRGGFLTDSTFFSGFRLLRRAEEDGIHSRKWNPSKRKTAALVQSFFALDQVSGRLEEKSVSN